MPATLIGYARCSTAVQDLTAQRGALFALGATPKRIYIDHGRTRADRDGPGLRDALAACHGGDILVVTKLDRLARSLSDARKIVEELTTADVKINIGGSVHDPTDPAGRLLLNVLGMIAANPTSSGCGPEGMKLEKAKGNLRGQQPRLKPTRKLASSNCSEQARTPAPNSLNWFPLPSPPSTEPYNVAAGREPRSDPVRRLLARTTA